MIHDLSLIHYTNEPFEFDRNYHYNQDQHRWQAKPVGLWFSVQGPHDWNWWCRAEDFRVEHLAYEYKIKLNKDANILHLTDSMMIFYLSKRYPLKDGHFRKRLPFDVDDTHELDWNEIKRDYQGIIISPYQWECRLSMESSWYYGWDCSSGCIWDLNCIQSFEFLGEDLEAPTEPDKKPCMMEFVKKSMIDAAQFLSEDDHEKHEYEFCERTISTSIQYLKSKRKEDLCSI